jgi:ferrous iron transport protein A
VVDICHAFALSVETDFQNQKKAPTMSHTKESDPMMPLALLSPGESGEIVSVNVQTDKDKPCCGQCGGERHQSDNRVEEMGLRAGKIVEMLSNGSGPLLLRIDESRIAISRGMAMKISVRRA